MLVASDPVRCFPPASEWEKKVELQNINPHQAASCLPLRVLAYISISVCSPGKCGSGCSAGRERGVSRGHGQAARRPITLPTSSVLRVGLCFRIVSSFAAWYPPAFNSPHSTSPIPFSLRQGILSSYADPAAPFAYQSPSRKHKPRRYSCRDACKASNDVVRERQRQSTLGKLISSHSPPPRSLRPARPRSCRAAGLMVPCSGCRPARKKYWRWSGGGRVGRRRARRRSSCVARRRGCRGRCRSHRRRIAVARGGGCSRGCVERGRVWSVF